MRDRRQVVNGILWKMSTGATWRDLPERCGPWKTAYERFRHWSADGTGDRLLAHVQQHSHAVGQVDRTGASPDPPDRVVTDKPGGPGCVRLLHGAGRVLSTRARRERTGLVSRDRQLARLVGVTSTRGIFRVVAVR
ncbi:hypothetical protein ATE80_16440 [Streptomyces kanasensis]|uniref:Insertion element IS402-like domain-containing protein n=1 Tax=Streptomyces kanasensis TaxID=936756 RepID=A0A100Y4V7_9ACTN|nr:hypothetical protein ATE80_16440 [Streptomyces kanasensis]